MDLLAHERLHAYTLAKAHERNQHFWQSDLVVVVTWHSRELDSLRAFPLDVGAKFALQVKGGLKSCETDIPDFLAPHVVLCEQLENAEGRDTHTIASFLERHYHHLPRLMFFLQDDPKPRTEFAHIPTGDAAKFEAWLSRAEADPFADSHTCLCGLNVESWISPRTNDEEFDVGGYGGMYHPQQYLLETFLGWCAFPASHRACREFVRTLTRPQFRNISASNITALRWPGACSFTLSARAVRKQPKMLFTLLAELLLGGKERFNILRMCPDIRGVEFCRGARDLAHVIERLWFALLDDKYETRDLTPR